MEIFIGRQTLVYNNTEFKSLPDSDNFCHLLIAFVNSLDSYGVSETFVKKLKSKINCYTEFMYLDEQLKR